MIEQLKQIWLGMTPKMKLIALGSIFLFFALLILLLVLSRSGAPVPSRAPTASVVLNEVLFYPPQDQFQFVELKNINGDVPLAGLKLSNEKKDVYVFPSATPNTGRGELLLIIFDGGNRIDGRTVHADRKDFLNRISGFAELLDEEGRVLDRVAWGKGQAGGVNLGRGGVHADFIPGTSIARYPLSVKSNNFLEWLTFSAEEVTPGKSNPNPRVEVLLPLDGAFFPQPSIELSWYPVAGAKSYRIQISDASEFGMILEDKTVQAPSFKTPTLKAAEYFWRVQAIFEDGSSANFSPVSSFTISSTELPSFSDQSSRSLFPSAFAVETVPPIREGVLAVPMIYQHKDTAMLLMESRNESGDHAWDKDHKELDENDPADNMNCALASTAMVNNFAGGDLSQDRIGYEIRKEDFPDDPMLDLNYGKGLSFRENIDWDEIDEVLTFAFNGATVTRHTPTNADAFWDMVTREIDAGRPILTRKSVTADSGHAFVISGYYQFALTGPNARWVTINDPWSGRYLVNLSRMSSVTHYWLVSDISNPRNNEAGVTRDSDGDGMVDFDETERFKTTQSEQDSDEDKVNDKKEVYATVFDPNHGWSLHRVFGFGRDFDGDTKAMELDEDSDGGGCKDGEEDKNANGKRDGGETYNFDKEDDECGVGPLGGKVRMTYAYAPVRAANCIGRMEINTRFALNPLNPVKVPGAPDIVITYGADNMTYDIRTDGCPDAPGDHLLYEFKEGFHLSGTIPLTEENLGFAVFFPSWPKFDMQLPYELTDPAGVAKLIGRYTTISGGGPWPAETSAVFEPLNIESDPAYCANPNDPDRLAYLDFCVEPTPCADQLNAPLECLSDPQRYYVIPFKKSFRWDTPGFDEPGAPYHIGNVDVTVEICEGCGDEFSE